MRLDFAAKLARFLAGASIIAVALLFVLWYSAFQGVFLFDDLLSEHNILGIIGIIAILVFGGIYLLQIGVNVMRSSVGRGKPVEYLKILKKK